VNGVNRGERKERYNRFGQSHNERVNRYDWRCQLLVPDIIHIRVVVAWFFDVDNMVGMEIREIPRNNEAATIQGCY
jgi:hypothetical protein